MFSPSSCQKRRSRLISSPLASGRRRSVCIPVSKSSNVKVCIRVRPISEKETSFKDGKQVVEVMDERVLVFDPVEIETPSFHRGRAMRDPTARRCRDLKFAFGRVFGPDAANGDVFEETTRLTLDCLMNGVNCSVFAYGATGAGKTFTMLGTPSNKGVIARTVHALYERIESNKDSTVCEVEVSYLEIYNETVRDLLNPTGQELVIRESTGAVVVAGLTFHKPANVDELFQMLETGNAMRTQHPTDANEESSRSHAVFHIYLKQRDRATDLSSEIVMSKMALIDLAGSERAAATANCGKRFREGANINRSLLALGNCINALADGKKGNHIPYRDSKLTRILKDSLGGSCQTVMIAAVSPSAAAYDDTYNTLKYADRAQKIKVDLKSNVYRVDHHVHQYGKIVDQLQTEISTLRERIAVLESEKLQLKKQLEANRHVSSTAESDDCTTQSIVIPLRQMEAVEINKLVERYVGVQGNILKWESQRRVLQLKLKHREKSKTQLSDLQWDAAKIEQASSRWNKYRLNCSNQIVKLEGQVSAAVEELQQLKKELGDICGWSQSSDLSVHCGDVTMNADSNPSSVSTGVNQTRFCQLNSSEMHWKQVSDSLASRVDQQDSVIDAMASQLKEQYLVLKSYGFLTSAMVARYESVEKVIEGPTVRWLDQCENTGDSQGAILTELALLPDHSVVGNGLNPAVGLVQNTSLSRTPSQSTLVNRAVKRKAIQDVSSATKASTGLRRFASSASMNKPAKWRF